MAETPPTIRRVKASARLVLRADVGLQSQKKGDLARGEPLLLLEEMIDPSGVVRAKVAKDSTPRGVSLRPCHGPR